ncbi:hypothetical protein OESDEN_19666 [Oesophagostomum dentatum]|uniref:RNA cytosine-C(5)-methyltransferase NSUN2-like pre-PUA domain-containing protein n=1 Tax=Oesophagostomum dentatum TaxID=61180 RepID=A0A0B1S9V8_OESDE|nr:hypothetical protein OESDEN_19666 [Oesophagostomum dentatum]
MLVTIGLLSRAPAYKKQKMFKDEPFTFLKKDDDRWFDIKGHYGIRDGFEYENLFSRRLAENDANCRQLFYANDAVKDFVVSLMAPAYKKQKMFKDEPFTFLKKDDDRWFDIK